MQRRPETKVRAVTAARGRRLATAACALLAAGGVAAAAPGTPDVRRLDNGLEVVLLEDHSLPQVVVSLWVRSGSKDEIESSAGYAHYLEHLLQGGTDPSAPYEYGRLANRRGGSLSVRSNYDRTQITLTGIAATLDDLLTAASEMAFRATLRDDQIRMNLATLSQEMRSFYDLPSSVAFLETMRHAFPSHPYRFAMLGNMRSIATLKSGPLTAFYTNLYVPNNMALVVAGDFDPAGALAQVKRAFGKAARSATVPPRPAAPEAFAGHDDFEKRLDLREPWATLSFVGPGFRHPDRAAFEVIARALGDPAGSPVLAALMRERAGSQAQVSYYGLEDAGMLYVALNPATSGLSYVAARAALQEIAGLKKSGLKEAELRRHVDRILLEKRLAAEVLASRAESLGEAALMGGVRYHWDLPRVFARLTPADIKRVADTYLVAGNLRLVVILPKLAPAPGEESRKAFHDALNALGGATARSPHAFNAVLYPAEQAKGATADAWGDPGSAARPGETRRTALDNGMTVIVLEDHRHGLAAASLQLRSGSGDDPEGREGLANLALRALARGVASQARAAADGREPAPAGPPEVQLTRDHSELRLLVRSAEVEGALASIAVAIRTPRINQGLLEDLRRAALAALDRTENDPTTTGIELLREKVYHSHAYAHAPSGTAAGLGATTADDLAAFQAAHLRPARAVLAVAGDVLPADVVRMAQALFGDWDPAAGGHAGGSPAGGDPGGGEPAGAAVRATASAMPGEYSRLLRGERSLVLLGVPGCPLVHDDFPALRTIGTALTLQAFEDLVFTRRAAFSAVAVPEGLRQGGLLSIEITAPHARRDETVFDLQRLARRLTLEPLEARDLRDVARMQAGTSIAAAQGVRAMASTLSYREIAGLGAAAYRADFEPVPLTAEGLRDLARRYLQPESWIIVKVGPGAP